MIRRVGLLLLLALSSLVPLALVAAPPQEQTGDGNGESSTAAETVAPVVPGYEALRASEAVGLESMGEVLLGELNCLSCHHGSPSVAARITTKPAPDLTRVGSRATADWIARFVADPGSVKPGTTMPALLGGLGADERAETAEAIAHFLVHQGGGPADPVYRPFRFPARLESGRERFHSVGCVACHPSEPERASGSDDPRLVPLPGLATKWTVAGLVDFLLDPAAARPGLRMPDLHLTEAEATDIAVWLLRDQALPDPLRVAAFEYEFYEDEEDEDADGFWTRPPPDFDAWPVASTGSVRELTPWPADVRRSWNYGVRYSGLIRVDAPDRYGFELRADSRAGAELIVDGEVVATKPRESGRIATGAAGLGRGDHRVEITYYMRGDTETPRLEVTVTGPSFGQAVPIDRIAFYEEVLLSPDPEGFQPDPAAVRAGGRAFTRAGCSACHALPAAATDVERAATGAPLAGLTVGADATASWHRESEAPRYGLNEQQRTAIGAALADPGALERPRPPADAIVHTLATYGCYACHERNVGDSPVGGPSPSRTGYFRVVGEQDVGNEGRFPPTLSGVGGRLRREAIGEILRVDRLHVRSHLMRTRMPAFGGDPIAALPALLEAVDSTPGDFGEPELTAETAEAGRLLVGSDGMRCIACHAVGPARSTGISTIDLTTVHERVRPGWLRRFLRDPAGVRPGTRMPSFWPSEQLIFPEVGDGTVEGQLDAILSYLSLGSSMPPPAGTDVGDEMVLVPEEGAILIRTFMNEVGPRAIAVGFPESVHVAFDANIVRMAKVWRGGFFDASGTWQGRAGRFSDPHGTDVLSLPPGPALAVLPDPDAPWPQPAMTARDVGGEFLGYELDEQGAPIFEYRLGATHVREQPVPIVAPGGARLIRRFTLEGKSEGPLYLLAGEGTTIVPVGGGGWRVDDAYSLTITTTGEGEPFVRSSQGVRQLLLPVSAVPGQPTVVEVRLRW